MRKALTLLVLTMGVLAACVRVDIAQADTPARNTTVAETRARAEQGDAEAAYMLGRMYAKGEGVPQDYAQAVVWFRKAAGQGNAKGQNALGAMYESGLGVPQDYAQAVVWIRKAAEQGEAMAQSNLGVMYDTGKGVPQDYAQAAAWYGKAAVQGYAEAQFNLGAMYDAGQGVGQDDAQALAWYRKAAGQGNAAAQFNLGGMYETGRGVPQDYVEAHKWRNLAAAGATGENRKKFADGRDELAKSMTPAQVTEAQRLAQEWTEAFARQAADGTIASRTAEPPPAQAAEQAQPSLRIRTMEVVPDVVQAGSRFNIVLEYTVADPWRNEKELPVQFAFSILQGSETLYSPKSADVNSINGGGTKRTEPMTASKRKGTYTVKVNLQYKGVHAEESREFTIK